jgi:hypothetical protein
MVGCSNPVSLPVAINALPHLDNLSGNFVAKDERCALDAIPFHYIASANAARFHPNEQFTRAYCWSGYLLYTDIFVTVVHGHAHVGHSPGKLKKEVVRQRP